MKYRPEIDGLRAVAVISVIIFHAGFELFSGGFVGVDVFFVISGFLITTIILDEMDKGAFSIVKFYERRVRRILPALFLVIACCLPIAWFAMIPPTMPEFVNSIIAVMVFASNILFWKESGYFATAAEFKPLLHTWSLAVEEQFYIFFPIFLMIAWRLGKRWIVALLAGVFAVSLALAHWGAYNMPHATFFLLPTRAWELMIGSFIAFAPKRIALRENPIAAQLLSLAGLSMIAVSIVAFDEQTPFPSLYALMPTVGSALIILFATPGALVHKLLSSKLFVSVGLISYSAYLWHQPIFAFYRIISLNDISLLSFVILAGATFALAALTTRYVEAPFRAKPALRHMQRKHVFSYAVICSMLFLIVGFAIKKTDVFDERFQLIGEAPAAELSFPRMEDGYCFYNINGIAGLDLRRDLPGCKFGPPEQTASTLVFGDSYAAQWEPFLARFAEDYGVAMDVLTTNWCFPTFRPDFTAPRGHLTIEQCKLNRDFVREHLGAYRNFILSGAWPDMQDRHYADGVFAAIDDMLAQTGSRIVLLDAPPQLRSNAVIRARYHAATPLVVNEARNQSSLDFWAAAQQRYRLNPRVLLVGRDDFGARYAATGRASNGFPYSLDGSHISVFGAKQLYAEYGAVVGGKIAAFLDAPR